MFQKILENSAISENFTSITRYEFSTSTSLYDFAIWWGAPSN